MKYVLGACALVGAVVLLLWVVKHMYLLFLLGILLIAFTAFWAGNRNKG